MAEPARRTVAQPFRRRGGGGGGSRPKGGNVQILSKLQIQAMAECSRGSRWYLRDRALIVVGYHLAARVSELAGMTMASIDDRGEGGFWMRWYRPKNRDTHTMELAPAAVEALGAYLLERRATAGALQLPGASPLFLSRKGGPLQPRGIQQLVERLGGRAGIAREKCHPHSLRHSRLTHLLEDGYDVSQVQAIAAHANLATTSAYVHLARGWVSEAAVGSTLWS